MSAADRYAVERTGDPLETHALVDRDTRARVTLAPPRGGLVTRFEIAGEPVLYLDEVTLRDPSKNVRGGIPVLFPIAGPLRGDQLVLGDRTFEMKQHGFARSLRWSTDGERADETGAHVTMRVRDDATTRAKYPFAFELAFTARLSDGVLHLEQRFANTGREPMPIQPGLHPYFALPDDRKAAARVETDATQGFDNVQKRPVSVKGPLDLTAAELDVYLLDHHPRETRLVRPGMRDVVLRFGDDQHAVVVWTLRGKDYVCVEPWTRTANALNEGRGIVVEPGESHETTLTISLG